MRTAILIHAQFLLPEVWPNVMWGDPQHERYGIISKGVELALRGYPEQTELIYLCSGIPKVGGREFSPDAREFLFNHLHELPRFNGQEGHLKWAREWLSTNIIFDDVAQTTIEEVQNAGQIFQSSEIERVVGVTAPKHAMRALQILLQAVSSNDDYLGIEAVAAPSDINFPLATASDVAILEAAHRHDAHESIKDLHTIGTRLVSLMRKGDWGSFMQFRKKLDELFTTFNV